MDQSSILHGTTILAVRHHGRSAIAGDGQVTLGRTVMKHGARKIRRLHNGQVLAGFAGSTADALALFAKFEAKIEEYRGNLERAAVELSKEWRTDRVLRRLEAFLVVADLVLHSRDAGTADQVIRSTVAERKRLYQAYDEARKRFDESPSPG